MKIILLLALVLGGTAFVFKDDIKAIASTAEKSKEYDKVFNVKKGGFQITLNLDGTLKPIKQYDLKPQTQSSYPYEITFIAETNKLVKKGDVICRLSDERYKATLEILLVDLDYEQKNIKIAEEDLNALEFNNIADVKNAAVALRQSKEALIRYRDEDSLYAKRNLLSGLEQADENITNSENALKLSIAKLRENQDKNLIKSLENDVKSKENALKGVSKSREKAFYDLRVFKKYSFRTKIQQLQEAVTKSNLALQNIIISAKADIIKTQQRISINRKAVVKVQADIDKVKNIIKNLVLTAPEEGIFSISASKNQNGQPSAPYSTGSSIRYGQIVGVIPDMTKFLIQLKVPEAQRSLVREGLPTEVSIKSLPGVKITGKVDHISTLAIHDRYWDKNSPKKYPTKVSTDQADERLTPGMSVNVDIIISKLQDVFYVPIEAAYNKDGDTFVRIEANNSVKEVKVKTGRSSVDYVEITEGLSEGDKVVLNWESSN